MKLRDQSAIITGASQGLGLAIAEAFVAEGASVLLCARDGAAIEAVRQRLAASAQAGQKISATVCDVGEVAAVDQLIATGLREFGHIDVLVNNAGIYGPLGAIEDVDWAEWVDAININLMGTVYPCRAVIPAMKARRRGKIINLSGGGATNPLPRVSAYAASKAAVVRFTETLALELKPYGIDVNAVAPGALATRLMDQVIEAGPDRVGAAFHDRMKDIHAKGGTPLSVGAKCCVWLASQDSNGMTGKLVAAQWDPYQDFPAHAEELEKTDIYTLRRIVPKDRGMTWGND